MAQIKEQLFPTATYYNFFFCFPLKLGWLYQLSLLKGQKHFFFFFLS